MRAAVGDAGPHCGTDNRRRAGGLFVVEPRPEGNEGCETCPRKHRARGPAGGNEWSERASRAALLRRQERRARAGGARLRSAATMRSRSKAPDRRATPTAMYRSIPQSMPVSPGHEKNPQAIRRGRSSEHHLRTGVYLMFLRKSRSRGCGRVPCLGTLVRYVLSQASSLARTVSHILPANVYIVKVFVPIFVNISCYSLSLDKRQSLIS
jgi:hypothetical protein